MRIVTQGILLLLYGFGSNQLAPLVLTPVWPLLWGNVPGWPWVTWIKTTEGLRGLCFLAVTFEKIKYIHLVFKQQKN